VSSLASDVLIGWPLLICEVPILGLACFVLAVAPQEHSQDRSVERRMTSLIRSIGTVGFLLSPIALLVSASHLAGASLRDAVSLIPQIVRETHVGRIWLYRLALAGVIAVTAWIPLGRSGIRAVASMALAMLLLQALAGHAVDKGAASVAVYFVHQAAVSVWIGSLVGLWLCSAGTPRPSEDWLRLAARRTSRVAGWCVAVIAASGAYFAYGELGLSATVWLGSLYGRTLAVKLVPAALAAGIGGYSRYRVVTSLRPTWRRELVRNVCGECLLLAAVLMFSAVLADSPPPHLPGPRPRQNIFSDAKPPSERRIATYGAKPAFASQ
jgi:putative copper resistance protein D